MCARCEQEDDIICKQSNPHAGTCLYLEVLPVQTAARLSDATGRKFNIKHGHSLFAPAVKTFHPVITTQDGQFCSFHIRMTLICSWRHDLGCGDLSRPRYHDLAMLKMISVKYWFSTEQQFERSHLSLPPTLHWSSVDSLQTRATGVNISLMSGLLSDGGGPGEIRKGLEEANWQRLGGLYS